MFIYFVQWEPGGPIKIGYSKNVEERVRWLQCGTPFDFVILAVVKGARSDEARLHRILGEHRIRREWFSPAPDVLLAVERAKAGTLAKWLVHQRKETPMRNIKHPIDRDAPASVVAEKFGGLSKLAQALDKSTSTVQKWLLSGHIPPAYHDDIIAKGEALSPKVRVKPVDFVTRRKPVADAQPEAATA